MVQTILTFVIIFSILVIFHEFGHFYFAKKAGILVREFSIGMGPKIFFYRKNGTTYTLRLLPFGGYVRMAGYGDEEADLKPGMPVALVLDPHNEVQTLDLSQKPRMDTTPMEITDFDLENRLFVKGIVPGAETAVTYPVSKTATIIEQDGTEVQIAPLDVQFQSATLPQRMMTNFAGPMNNFILGIIVYILIAFLQGGVYTDTARLGEIEPDSPAAQVGLQEGDVVTAADGEELSTWSELVTIIQNSPAEPLELDISRASGETQTVTVTPEVQEDAEGNTYGIIGVHAPVDESAGAKIKYGFTQSWTIATAIFGVVGSMFTSGFDVDAFGGPVAIYAATEEVVSYGLISILSFLAYLSINLGIVNLLPIPALDGGKLVLNLVEAVRGKPLEPEKEGIITAIGVGLLLILMILVTWNDIQRFFFG